MEFGLVALYVATVLVRPQEWWEPVRGWRLVDVIAISSILVTLMSQRRGRPSLQAVFRTPLMRVLMALLVLVLLSHWGNFRLRTGLDAFADFGKICVLFSLVMLTVDRTERVRKMMWVLLACAMMFCIHGLLQIRTGIGLGEMVPLGNIEDGTLRIIASGIFSDPNDFAMLFSLTMPFLFTMLRTGTAPLLKALLCAFIPGFLFCLFHTQSRGGVVGLASMLLAYIWLGGKRSFGRLVITAILIAVVVAFGPRRARETVYEGSAGGRVMEWGIGIGMLKQSPLFGIGYNRWLDVERRAAHNSYVNAFAELGLLGYSFWFTFVWLIVKYLSRITRLRDKLPPSILLHAGGVYAALMGYLASAFFLTRSYNPVLFCLLGMGAGMILYVQNAYPELAATSLRITQRDIGGALLMAMVSIPAVWLAIRIYYAGAGVG